MIKEIVHIGLTVSNLEQSICFYRDVLGLKYEGRMTMQGKNTDLLFGHENCIAHVAYLNGSNEMYAPPVELIEFENPLVKPQENSLTNISISELCFNVEDIEEMYLRLKAKGVNFISSPQYFDLTQQGFGKSKAVYLKDPDGIILELIETIK